MMKLRGYKLKNGDKLCYCFNCKQKTVYTRRDKHGNIGVDSHCMDCKMLEYQNRDLERKLESWLAYNNAHGLSC